MRIEQSGRKSANDVTANLKCLVDRWRLMDRSGNRLGNLGGERERIEVTGPTNHIEWIVRHGHAGKSRAILDQKIDILLLVDSEQFAWSMQIALRVGGTHFNLDLVIQITFRNAHRAKDLENQMVFLFDLIRHHP